MTPTFDTPEYRKLRSDYEAAEKKFALTNSDTDFLAMYQIGQKIAALEDAYRLRCIADYLARAA